MNKNNHSTIGTAFEAKSFLQRHSAGIVYHFDVH